MKKIVLTGPESSGKTTLVKLLAEHYHAPWVPEYARSFLTQLQRPYIERDLLDIAIGQVAAEDRFAIRSDQLLFCDTDLITIKIWQQQKFGSCYQWINRQIIQRHYDAYLLCSPDIRWEADPLRENPYDRDRLYRVYVDELTRLGKTFFTIFGSPEERLQQAIKFLNALEA